MIYTCKYCGETYPYEPAICNDCGSDLRRPGACIVDLTLPKPSTTPFEFQREHPDGDFEAFMRENPEPHEAEALLDRAFERFKTSHEPRFTDDLNRTDRYDH